MVDHKLYAQVLNSLCVGVDEALSNPVVDVLVKELNLASNQKIRKGTPVFLSFDCLEGDGEMELVAYGTVATDTVSIGQPERHHLQIT